uniref:Extracellular metalloproteinase n=1 Tax=Pleurotus salmoneostramineus TaxID=64638 RepID=A0A455VRL9_9AGAR|nr:metalloprotease [Pleurotus salmoneostramineus]
MVAFNKFFTSVFLAVAYASVSSAVPYDASMKHATHRVREVGRGLKVEAYHPATSYSTFGEGVEDGLNFRAFGDLKSKTLAAVRQRLGIDERSIDYKSGYSQNSGSYGYVKQKHNDIPFANAVANVAFKDNKLVAFGSSFVKPKNIAASSPSLPLSRAISIAEAALNGKHNSYPPSLEYYAKPDGSAALTHVIQIQNETEDTWFEAFVDAHTGDVLSVTDFVAEASYYVLPIDRMVVPEGLETVEDPQNSVVSPLGWHNDGKIESNSTTGNNVVAYKGSQSSLSTQTSDGHNFIYEFDVALEPTAGQNLDVARTNAFYVSNMIHDISYLYGFTEKAFNFQNDNFDNEGKGNDRVLMSVQDASGTNNANFATPADGQSGRCRMYLWTMTTPRRDGSLENDIIAHELTHGLTNRMTGGGTGRCLQTTEAGGMGEGWSDAFADWLWQKDGEIKDYKLGWYVYKPEGIRKYPYSTDPAVNPLKYSNVKGNYAVHSIGEVWANMLHNVHAALVKEHGYSSTAFTNPNGTEGNVVFMKLFVGALALQPCNPTFVQARDAWFQADKDLYGGIHTCLIWKAFASKGLGVKAEKFNNDETIPTECGGEIILSPDGGYL